jgi:C4-dicarboxylate transporter DctM subunit
MSLELIGAIGMGLMFLLMFLRMPLGGVMMLVGVAGCCYIMGLNQGLFVLSSSTYKTANSYMLTTLPLFILMATFASKAGMSEDAFLAINKWVGHLRGGLAMGTAAACAIFAAVCGSGVATAATMCGVAYPEMRKQGYSDQLSVGIICSGGQLGFMIPPSIPFIVYAFLTEESVGDLFMAGVVPGILITILFIVTIYLWVWRDPGAAPPGPRYSWKDRFIGIQPIWGIVTLIVFVFVGIYSGFFTATEAGGLGSFGALVLGIIKRKLPWAKILEALVETGRITSMIFLLIIGAQVFSSFMAISEVPFWIADYIGHSALPKMIIVLVLVVVYVILGFVMDIMGAMVLTVPILYPLLEKMSIDPVWFAVLVVLTVMIGEISPPIGIVMFAVAGYTKEPLEVVFRGVWPFFYAMLVALVILILFPELSLWLPHLMKG